MSVKEHKQIAKNTNELVEYLIRLIEENDKRFSFEWAVGGELATMEVYDKKNEIGYVVKIKPLKYDSDGNAINI